MTTEQPIEGTQLGITVRQIAVMMRDSPSWEPAVLQHYQRLQLSQLIQHARQNVPFYADRLNVLCGKDGEIDWSRWQDIPILKRADLRDSAEQLLARTVPALHGPLHHATSSGSTGIPVKVIFPRLFTHVADVAWDRFYRSHNIEMGYGYTDFRPELPAHVEPGTDACKITEPELAYLIRRDISPEQKLDWLEVSPFKVLRDTPNHMEILARINLRRDKPVQLDSVIGIGMGFTSQQTELIAESFGAKSVSPYSSKEGTLIGYQCHHGNDHFHNCAELVLLEVVDERGKEVPAGVQGRCIITPFFNSAQPLIRYEQGDILVKGEGCPGGVTLPVIKEISGRQDSIFSFAGRDMVIIGLEPIDMQNLLKADAFQFAQTGPEHVEVRYIARVDVEPSAASQVAEKFCQLAGMKLEIVFKRVEDLPFNSGGKQQRFVREYFAK
jgi:phenylacetate-CoA ligase